MAASLLASAMVALAGCISSPVQDVSAFNVPALPPEFVATYQAEDGRERTIQATRERSLDRWGHIGILSVVRTDQGSFGVDGCGAPAWRAEREEGDGKPRWRLEPTGSPLWMQFQGTTVRDGDADGAVILQAHADGFGYNETAIGDVRYGSRPVPESWQDGTTVWRLVDYEGPETPGKCRDSPSALLPMGRDGLGSMPTFPQRSLASVLVFLRGPLGPPAFQAWEDAHPNARIAYLDYVPPLGGIIFPDPTQPATWQVLFQDGEETHGVRCRVNASDRLVPVDQKPIVCGDPYDDLESHRGPPVSTSADPVAGAEALEAMGLAPTAIRWSANATSGGLMVQHWRTESSANGFRVDFYWLAWDHAGRLVWASLPVDAEAVFG